MTAPLQLMPPGQPGGFGAVDNTQDPAQEAVQTALAQTFQTHEQATPSPANAIVKAKPPEFVIELCPEEAHRRLAAALYGSDFPPLQGAPDQITDDRWVGWLTGR